MKEFVGNCTQCSKDIYCFDGFLNGVVLKNKALLCFECHKNKFETRES